MAGTEFISLTKRLNNVLAFVDQQPSSRVDDGTLFRDALVAKAIVLIQRDPGPSWGGARIPKPDEAGLVRALEVEGFTIADGALRRILPVTADLPQAEDDITRLLDVHGFSTPKGHFQQALDAHGRGNWAAANGQLRSFLERLLDEIAIKLDHSAASMSSSQNRRAHLANIVPPFLDRNLNEWGDNGVGFVNGLWARLHPQGSHPGLSDEADSTFRLHVVLITARLLLVRFDARMRDTP